ncbi:ABC transporter ATP-binding protein [Clostridium felsineum]|uniref:ABC transporter ATP-binding protein n=1 Tax=Clostridium felsineum TaxID=36839 RepID=UPI00098C6EA4|nr:ABC transporter ATP-binding protein [Clostridium felsineum]URZ18166.1 Putative multidrug export ATP-binding/permease protein [Clostridium felsineum DSM 794]
MKKNKKSQFAEENSTLKWALKMAWEIDKKTMILWMIVGIMGALIPVFFLTVTKKIIDIINVSIEKQSGFSIIIIWIAVLMIFLFLSALYEIFPDILKFTMHSKYSVGMQKKMGEWVETLPIRLFDNPDMVTKINMTMPTIKRLGFFMQNGISFLSLIIGIIGIIILALNNSLLLFIVGIILTCIALPIGFYNAKCTYRLWRDDGNDQRISDYYYGLVFDYALAREYRTLNLNKIIKKKWNSIVVPMNLKNMKLQNNNEFRWNMLALINMIFKFSSIFVAFIMVKNKSLTIGEIVLFISVFDQLSNGSIKVGREFMDAYGYLEDLGFQKDLISLDFSKEYLPKNNIEKVAKDYKNQESIEFEMKNVSYSYDNSDKEVLKNVSLKIHKGETIALVGNNGAGKSTLIKILLGFYKPTSGEILFEGKNYDEIDLKKLVNKIGVTFQDYAKFEFTLRENIAFGDLSKIKHDNVILEACKKGGINKILSRMNGNLDAHIGKWYESKGTNFSGGEWQRIAASRAYISDRDILIMDEPASALDPIAEMKQFNNIKSVSRGKTAILISHRIGFARLADKIAVLQDGKLVEFGDHDELISLKGSYYKMFIDQAKWYSKEEVL